MRLSLFAGEPVYTDIELLDCDPVGDRLLGDAGIVQTDCRALEGHSGERCGADFICASHADSSSCCIQLALCRELHPLQRFRACASLCPRESLSGARVITSCEDLRALSAATIPAQLLGAPCTGPFVCFQSFEDLAQPLPTDFDRDSRFLSIASAYYCAAGALHTASFFPYYQNCPLSP